MKNEELDILLYFQEHPRKSIADASRDLQFSDGKIWKILHKHKLKPFKSLPVSRLTEANKHSRREFCQLMITRLENDPHFFNKIIWTDEANFSTAGVFNRKNTHFWSVENPHYIKDIKFQGRQSFSVWCGILNNRILGPVFYRYSLTGPRFLNMMANEIEACLEEIPIVNYNNNMIWHQDGAPCHNTIAVTHFLNNKYEEWIGKFGTIRWAPNSPDLSLLDTFLWGHLKNECYKQRTENINQLQDRISAELTRLNENPEIILNSISNLKKRYRLCIEKQGSHFEQFL
ncbi:hypothetical protein NQ317_000243 [Molorchus minor]|uniref:Transposase n=1 Tax=Molorchus minor TaxID=1323400 RepID=A0ABQ9JSZ9_9CUCU|nr:hypothetical protein NQ317_000243 [Molorchus minor]